MLNAYDLDIASDSISLTDSRALYGSAGALPCLAVNTPRFSAVVSFQGAHLLSFAPAGEEDWLWLSPRAEFVEGRPIRGGIPICAPWFGVNRQRAELPKHGLLRGRPWRLAGADELVNHVVRLRFTSASLPEDRSRFAWPFHAELDMYLADRIVVSLRISNQGDTAMPCSFAFHTYLAADAAAVEIPELKGRGFLDNCRGLAASIQHCALHFDGEVDRVFEAVGGTQSLQAGGKTLYVSGKRCDTVVTWNPGSAAAEALPDVGEHYREFVCLERGMAFADELRLSPGEEHRALMTIARDIADDPNALTNF